MPRRGRRGWLPVALGLHPRLEFCERDRELVVEKGRDEDLGYATLETTLAPRKGVGTHRDWVAFAGILRAWWLAVGTASGRFWMIDSGTSQSLVVH